MSLPNKHCVFALVIVCVTSLTASAITIPAEENFDTNNASWRNSAFGPATYVATGGSDGGGFIQATYVFSSTSTTTPVVFRGHDEFNASGGIFTGNWIEAQANFVRAYVRHDLPVPTQFFVRVADPGFFPGAIAVDFTPVFPNVWTLVEFDLSPNSPQIVSTEGEPWADVFDNIGKLQFGPVEPASLANSPQTFTFQLDQIAVVPEPATLLAVVSFVACGMLFRARGRK